jgi:hypothetical protein
VDGRSSSSGSERRLANVRRSSADPGRHVIAPVLQERWRSVVIVMNDGLAFGAVSMFLLDDGRAIGFARLSFLDHGGPIAIIVAVVVG